MSWYNVRERGSRLGVRLTLHILRFFGYRAAALIVYIVSFYFHLVSPGVRKTFRVFHERAVGHSSWWMSYVTLKNFSMSVLDRAFVRMGRSDEFSCTIHGEETLLRLKEEGRGVIAMGSHLGSLEVAPEIAKRLGIRVAMLIYEARSSMLYDEFDRINPAFAESVVRVEPNSVGYMLEVNERFKQGEFIGVLGDRHWPGGASVRLPFLGVEREFPVGGYKMAAVLKAPVIFMIMVKDSLRHYHLFVEELSPSTDVPRKERKEWMNQLAWRYAERLEYFCRQYPLQWFNPYDFWEE